MSDPNVSALKKMSDSNILPSNQICNLDVPASNQIGDALASKDVATLPGFKLANDKPVNIGEEALLRAKNILAELVFTNNKSSTELEQHEENTDAAPPNRSMKRASPQSPTRDSTPVIKYRRGNSTPFRPPTITNSILLTPKTKHNDSISRSNSNTPISSRIPSISIPSSIVTPPETPDTQSTSRSHSVTRGSATSFNTSAEENFEFDDEFDDELVKQIDVSIQESSFVQ